jgi:ABC-type uncharacterized transport system permease subunit
MTPQVSVFQITIFLLYVLAAFAFATSRLPAYTDRARLLSTVAFGLSLVGVFIHAQNLATGIIQDDGLRLPISNVISLIAFQLAFIGVIGGLEKTLRGMTAGLLLLAALIALLTGPSADIGGGSGFTWQLQAHILSSIFAYGLLTVGAIVAVYALFQDRRLRAGKLSAMNHLFAPLETTEKLLFGITAAGFAGLTITIISGAMFVDDFFAQHLVHKTALSLLALVLFGILLLGRVFAGWRGRRAIYLYLGGFVILCLAYFGSRFILEEVLQRSWG